MNITVTLLDTATGLTAVADGFQAGWWAQGNGFCDCNRMSYFGHEPPDGTCVGSHRYLIVRASPDYSLRELNADYPEELLRRWLSKEDLR